MERGESESLSVISGILLAEAGQRGEDRRQTRSPRDTGSFSAGSRHPDPTSPQHTEFCLVVLLTIQSSGSQGLKEWVLFTDYFWLYQDPEQEGPLKGDNSQKKKKIGELEKGDECREIEMCHPHEETYDSLLNVHPLSWQKPQFANSLEALLQILYALQFHSFSNGDQRKGGGVCH